MNNDNDSIRSIGATFLTCRQIVESHSGLRPLPSKRPLSHSGRQSLPYEVYVQQKDTTSEGYYFATLADAGAFAKSVSGPTLNFVAVYRYTNKKPWGYFCEVPVGCYDTRI